MDIDISGLEVNQCDTLTQNRNDGLEAASSNQITFFKGTHKCHTDTTQVNIVNILRDCFPYGKQFSLRDREIVKSKNSRFWFSACIRRPTAE